jgi:hypothetical protein
MKRRSFLAMIGFAPVAAVVPHINAEARRIRMVIDAPEGPLQKIGAVSIPIPAGDIAADKIIAGSITADRIWSTPPDCMSGFHAGFSGGRVWKA